MFPALVESSQVEVLGMKTPEMDDSLALFEMSDLL